MLAVLSNPPSQEETLISFPGCRHQSELVGMFDVLPMGTEYCLDTQPVQDRWVWKVTQLVLSAKHICAPTLF